jgi:hypothetical protein
LVPVLPGFAQETVDSFGTYALIWGKFREILWQQLQQRRTSIAIRFAGFT